MVPNGIPVPLPCSELASRKPSRPAVKGDRINRPDIWLQAIRSKLCAGSCKQGAVHIWLAELLKRKPPKLAAVALAKRYHPDRGNQQTHELMANINAARTAILKVRRAG